METLKKAVIYKIRGPLRKKPVCYLSPDDGFNVFEAHRRFLSVFCDDDCNDAENMYFRRISLIRWNLWRQRHELKLTTNPLLDQLDRVFADWCSITYKVQVLEEEEFVLLEHPAEVIPFTFTIDAILDKLAEVAT